ncbi:MAG TPA: hypothetical protein VF691_17260 [Cytophagaceae bacterium]
MSKWAFNVEISELYLSTDENPATRSGLQRWDRATAPIAGNGTNTGTGFIWDQPRGRAEVLHRGQAHEL